MDECVEEVAQEPELNCALAPEMLPPQEPMLQVIPPMENLTIEPKINPMPVPLSQVESTLEQQMPPPDLFYQQQPPRPISEVLGPGSFFFLQVSLDF